MVEGWRGRRDGGRGERRWRDEREKRVEGGGEGEDGGEMNGERERYTPESMYIEV